MDNTTIPTVQYLYALLIAVSITCMIAVSTNTMPPRWDARYYVNMAQHGVAGNPNLRAPFAYRIGMPFMSRAVAALLSVSIEMGFRIVAWGFAVFLLMGIFAIAREFTEDYRHALMTMLLLSLSATHIKFSLFFYTLVDVSGYALIVAAFWALITRRLILCLIVSSVGLLFKEWLAIPWFILCLSLAGTLWHTKSRHDFAFLVISIASGASMILLPRIYISVASTGQFLDPINDPRTLRGLISVWSEDARLFNIFYAMASYWLPTLILLTSSRFHRLWSDLKGFCLNVMSSCLVLVLLLTMYGGANIFIFVSYSVAVQAIVVALLFRYGIGTAEKIYVVVAMLLYNKILLSIPLPAESLAAYIDFYGGWSTRVTLSTLMRFIEIGVFVLLAAGVRAVVARLQNASSGAGHSACPSARIHR